MTETFGTYLQSLEIRFPWIDWRKPVPITTPAGESAGFACRVCIARYGLRGDQLDLLYKTFEEAAEHIRDIHEENR